MLRTLTATAFLVVIFMGCGGTPTAGPAGSEDVQAATWQGRVVYEARTPTERGASEDVELRPARRVRVEAVAGDGRVLATTATADDGTFALEAPRSAQRLVVRARIDAPWNLTVTRDALGQDDYRLEIPLGPPELFVEVTASDRTDTGMAGALHIVDTELRGVEAVHRWTGQRLPPLFTYWGRGVTTNWSYFRGERPAGSGRFCLELLGGEAGHQHASDTDEHDEAIILHELGHFVMDRLSTDSSPGGNHPAGVLIDPGLAWEEGRATWFAAAVLGEPHYLDTIGVAPHGRLRVNHDLERGGGGPRGLGSEQGVAEILWDLADGAGGLADDDGDGVALGPAAVMQAMMRLRDVPGAYPTVGTFLQQVVAEGSAPRDSVKGLLAMGGHPEDLLPSGELPAWPSDVTLPGQANGKIDGFTNPAPSGGPNRPDTGMDAVHAYRVQVDDDGWLGVRLNIFGSGRSGDRENLDVELRDIRANLVASARGEDPVEQVLTRVQPGWYVIYVRDGGGGNQAGYRLDVWTE